MTDVPAVFNVEQFMAKIESAVADPGLRGLIDWHLPNTGEDQDTIVRRGLEQLDRNLPDYIAASKILNSDKA